MKDRFSRFLLAAAATAALTPIIASAQPRRAAQESAPAAPDYIKSTEVKGAIRSLGSSTVSGLVNAWSSAFTALHPSVTIECSGGDSSAAVAALIAGSSDITPISRPMNDAELRRFKDRFGYEPTRFIVAIDALAVFVHKDNPVQSLSLPQLDSIFSASRKRGGSPIASWGQLGLTGEWSERPVRIYGFGELTGGDALFKDLVLDGGDYSADMHVEPGSSAIVNAVGTYREAIGFASHYFATARTRMVPIVDDDGTPRNPTESACIDGTYPLARRLFVYTNQKPGQPLPPHVAEFLSFTLSRQGQAAATELGMFPVPADLAREQLAALKR